MKILFKNIGKIPLRALIVGISCCLTVPATAEITSVGITSTNVIGTFSDKPYTEITGTINGKAPGGGYHVPFKLSYPSNSTDSNGFAIVEPRHFNQVAPALRIVGMDYVYGQGYVHLDFGWDNSDITNGVPGKSYGNTTKLSDAHLVIRDAAYLVRHLDTYIMDTSSVTYVIGNGYGRTASLFRDFLRLKNNSSLDYDGFIITSAGGLRLDLTTERKLASYPGPLPEQGKVLAVNQEHSVQRLQGWLARGDTPSFRNYELTGIPETWKGINDLSSIGAYRQNPVGPGPVVKAMIKNLNDWITSGIEPPPSIEMAGSVGVPEAYPVIVPPLGCKTSSPTALLPLCRLFNFVLDSQGNATGGVRLPHVEVPIGVYTGLETNLNHPDITPNPLTADHQRVSQGGTFTPFSAEVLKRLYPTHGDYISKISAAVRVIRDQRYILGEDVGRYVSDGAHMNIGMPIPASEFDINDE